MRALRLATALAAAGILFLLGNRDARAQDSFTVYRGDEVGPRTLELDEEGFLNIHSFRQPLESLQPWFASDAGYRIAFGSLDMSPLWLEQEFKLASRSTAGFGMRVLARQAIDFDSDYIFLQPSVEVELGQGFEGFLPASLDFNKGSLDAGLGARFRDREVGIDYVQLSWIRADFLFNTHDLEKDDVHTEKPADVFEFQSQADIYDRGKLTAKVSYQMPSSFESRLEGRTKRFKRFHAWLLHRHVVAEDAQLFLEYERDAAKERLISIDPSTAEEEFEGEREFDRFLVEYQEELEEKGVERYRLGSQFLYFGEDERLPNDRKQTHTTVRRELTGFGAYRFAIADDVSLETTVYLTYLNNRNRLPYNEKRDGREEERFQGKISFFLEWTFAENAVFVLTPSFELDKIGWGGGGAQVRFRF